MSHHETVPAVTFGTHRLWISLWTRLGQRAENGAETGGYVMAAGGYPAAVNSLGPAVPRSRTVPVAGHDRTSLRHQWLSPGSTDPITATYISFTRRSIQVAGSAAVCGPFPGATTQPGRENGKGGTLR